MAFQENLLEIYDKLKDFQVEDLKYIMDDVNESNKSTLIEKYVLNTSFSKIKKDIDNIEKSKFFNESDFPIDFLNLILPWRNLDVSEDADINIETYVFNFSMYEIKTDLYLYELFLKFNNLPDYYFEDIISRNGIQEKDKSTKIMSLFDKHNTSQVEIILNDTYDLIKENEYKKKLISESNMPQDFLNLILSWNDFEVSSDNDENIENYVINFSIDNIKDNFGYYELFLKLNDLPNIYFDDIINKKNIKEKNKINQILSLFDKFNIYQINNILNNTYDLIKKNEYKKKLISESNMPQDFLKIICFWHDINDNIDEYVFKCSNDEIIKDLKYHDLFLKLNNLPDYYFDKIIIEQDIKEPDRFSQILALFDKYDISEVDIIFNEKNREFEEYTVKKEFFKKIHLLNDLSDFDLNLILNINDITPLKNREDNIKTIINKYSSSKVEEDIKLLKSIYSIPYDFLIEVYSLKTYANPNTIKSYSYKKLLSSFSLKFSLEEIKFITLDLKDKINMLNSIDENLLIPILVSKNLYKKGNRNIKIAYIILNFSLIELEELTAKIIKIDFKSFIFLKELNNNKIKYILFYKNLKEYHDMNYNYTNICLNYSLNELNDVIHDFNKKLDLLNDLPDNGLNLLIRENHLVYEKSRKNKIFEICRNVSYETLKNQCPEVKSKLKKAEIRIKKRKEQKEREKKIMEKQKEREKRMISKPQKQTVFVSQSREEPKYREDNNRVNHEDYRYWKDVYH